MSRARSAFLGIFAAEIAACAFALLCCFDPSPGGFLASGIAGADAFRAVFRQQLEFLQPVLFAMGAIGGLLVRRAGQFRIPIALAAAAGSATVAHELARVAGGWTESLGEFAGTAPLFLIPASLAALIALAAIRPALGASPLPTWVNRVFGGGAVVLVWVGAGMAWWLWPLVLMAPVALGLSWRWRRYALLLTPVVIPATAFASGVLGYATGTGEIMGYGLPGAEYFNLDRQTRAPIWNGGCVIFGPEIATLVPNNLALELMGRLFGVMPFAYDGPYPTRDEALALLDQSGTPVEADFEHGRMTFDGAELKLPAAVYRRMRRTDGYVAEPRPKLATKRLPPLLILGDAPGQSDRKVWLVDLARQRMLATYVDR
jgi:hypothetical protein